MGLGGKRRDDEKEGVLFVLSEQEALALQSKGTPILVNLKTRTRQDSSINSIIKNNVHEIVAGDVNGKRFMFGAKPDDFCQGRLFDDDVLEGVATCLHEAVDAVKKNDSERRTHLNIGREQTPLTVEVDILQKKAPGALETVRKAFDDFAEELGSKTTSASTRGVDSLSVSRFEKRWLGSGPRPHSLWPHFDSFDHDGRLILGSEDTDLFLGLCPYSRADRPMPNCTHGKLNPVDEFGYCCGTVVSIKAKEAYWLSRAGSGNDIVFIELRVLADGSKLYIPYKRAHAVLGVKQDRDNAVATLGRTGKPQGQLSKDVKALLKRAAPAPAPPRAKAPVFAPAARVVVGGFRNAATCSPDSCRDDACEHPNSGGGGGAAPFIVNWWEHDCEKCQELAKASVARAPPKRARPVRADNIKHRGTAETHISSAHYAAAGSSVPERCGEHKLDDDVLLVNACGHEGCGKQLKFMRGANATCDGAFGYCTDHVSVDGVVRKEYFRHASERCYGGDGCPDKAAHFSVAGAGGAGAAVSLCPKHFKELDETARAEYARPEWIRCYGGDGCPDKAAHFSVAGAGGAGAAVSLCPKHFKELDPPARAKYARPEWVSCDTCSSGSRSYVRCDGTDGGACPKCHGALDDAARKIWWRIPKERCFSESCGRVGTCPRLEDGPGLERLCPQHFKDLPTSARKLYKPPPKFKQKMCSCGATAKFFGVNAEPPRCLKCTLAPDPRKRDKLSKTLKRLSCGGMKRAPYQRCGDGMCGASAESCVKMINDDPVLLKKLRKCNTCGTEKVDKHKEAVAGYEFVDKNKRAEAKARAEARAAEHQ